MTGFHSSFHQRCLSAAAIAAACGAILFSTSCSDNVILDEALKTPPVAPSISGLVNSGDIFIVSGGVVSSAATPYPLHLITQWDSTGKYQRTVATSPTPTTTFYYGMDIDALGKNLYYSVENVDRVEKIDLSTLVVTTHILDANLSGATMRSVAMLSDGSMLAAESTTSIEKYDANKVRVTTNFPLTATASILGIKRISGNRFVVLTSGNPDQPKVYTNAGVLSATISGMSCTTNCDPADIVELPDGRFVISSQINNSLELFSSSFAYIGQLYKNTSVLIAPGPMAVMSNGDILVCTAALNTCERITISGNTGTRVGTQAFISDASLMRQPTSVVVVP